MQFQMFGIFLLFATAVGQSITNDSVTPWEILQQNGGIVIKQCPGQEGTLHVNEIKFNSSTMVVQVTGMLTTELTDGHIVAKITPGKAPKDASRWQRMKRKMVLSWNRAHSGKANQTQPFCSKQQHCPIKTGAQKLNFSFTSLPKLVVAGGYSMQFLAYDQTGGLVVCMEGALSVNHGKHGEVIRMLESCYNVPWSATENGDEQCEREIVNTGSCMKGTPDMKQHIQNHCRKACKWCSEGVEVRSVEASDSHRSHLFWTLAGFLVVTLYSIF